MNLPTILVAGAIAALVCLAIVLQIRNKKKGKGCPSCGCSTCGMASVCHTNKEENT